MRAQQVEICAVEVIPELAYNPFWPDEHTESVNTTYHKTCT